MTLLLLALIAAPDADFEKRVRPLLVEHCQRCHGPKKAMASLRLDTRAGLLKGGDGGAVVKPGDPDGSRLVQAVRHLGELKMPKKKLRDDQIEILAAWVKAGAPWPAEKTIAVEAWKTHWAFQPIRRPAIPATGTGRNPIDRFLGKVGPEADRNTLLRRLTYSLTGLPPTPGEMASGESYERAIERLLASPRFGEKQARHWLDVARYADTKGYVFFEEGSYPWGWTYRDWVIESLNADLPYDRFVKEQLAADLIPGSPKSSLRAMGFLALGGRFMNNVHDILDDRIDVVTRGLMGLTVACARCHDHKFDPVPTADYYALYGVFASCEEPTIAPEYDPPPKTEAYAKFAAELAKREKPLTAFLTSKRKALAESARTRAAEYLLAVYARRGQPRADEFMLIADPKDINPAMITRWQSSLDRRKNDPAWTTWHAYAGGKKEVPPGSHPRVAREFATPATSMKEVAQRYARLLNGGGLAMPDDVTAELFSELQLLPDRAAQGVLQKHRKPVEQWRATGPGAPPRANVLRDKLTLHDPVVFRRGNPSLPGARVPRRFLTLLGGKAFAQGSGRLEMAQAIASRDNPLTARVIVNRLWMHHFGQGLVSTPGDFGLRASPPTHPALLDWLASELIDSGWSLKHLHRLIVSSSAFRQQGEKARRRLSLEEMRDALLVAGGNLDSRIGGPSVKGEMGAGVKRRTLYSHVDRLAVQGLFRTFDFPSPDASSPERSSTLVPQQLLFLMNSPFALHASRSLAQRTASLKEAARVTMVYRIAYGRDPSIEEIRLAQAFTRGRGEAGWAGHAQALLLSNEFSYVD